MALTWEQKVLRYDPFASDEDDGEYRLLWDKILMTRAPHRCAECGGPVAKGERVRAMAAVGDGHVATAYSCHACCDAMVAWMDGDEEPLIARLAALRGEER